MDNKLKKILIWTGSILAGAYLLFLISPVIFSPILDSYSDEIEDTLTKTAGFDVDLDDLSVVTSWNLAVGVKVKKITLSSPVDKKEFFSAENAGGKISLLPLIVRKIQIDSVFADKMMAILS